MCGLESLSSGKTLLLAYKTVLCVNRSTLEYLIYRMLYILIYYHTEVSSFKFTLLTGVDE